MTRPLLAIFAIMILAMPALAAAPVMGDPEIGQQAPSFTLNDLDGNIHSLSDYLGKIIVLEWTNHGCPYVRKHYDSGNMQKLQEQATINDDVVWFSIVSSAPDTQGYTTAEQAKEIVTKENAKATARLLDPAGTTGKAYGAKTTPHMFIIDSNGILAYKGAIDDMPDTQPGSITTAHNYVSTALEALKEGHEPAVSQSNPYGCAIKYGHE